MSAITRPPTSQNIRVLDIPEILEAILLHVDMRTLLVSALRVSRFWYFLVARSPQLQRHLFFREDFSAGPADPKMNPLLRETFPFCFPRDDDDGRARVYAKSERCATQGEGEYHNFARRTAAHVLHNPVAFNRLQASWRRMLVQQPPLKEVGDLVTMAPDQRVLACQTRAPDRQMVAGRFLPSYVRMPDVLSLALAPMDVSLPNMPEGPVAVSFRVLWRRRPGVPRNGGTQGGDHPGLAERVASDYGVVVHNIGTVEPSPLRKSVARLREIAVSYKLTQNGALFVSINLEAITSFESVTVRTHLADEEPARNQYGVDNAPTVFPCDKPSYLIPPDGRGDGADGERPEGAHQQTAVAQAGPAGVEDAEQEQVHSSSQPEGESGQGSGAHGAGEASSGRGRAGCERRLEPVRRDVVDEWHVRVRPPRVPRAPEHEPPPQQRRQRQQPEGAREQGEEPEAALREEGGRGGESLGQAGPWREAAVCDEGSDLDSLHRSRVDVA
ncbi:hypothetical protein DL762_001224 [Monosporascus cannonballus]|uniref:F-box domain-containing protein n=1 Tax=Monosporascus cannonballus TaxID=155416 RepID=A0ABY0HHN1_9PEZI|nr:hypothetical protein DL762_001224 [Monosporascus cannonballus]